MKKIKKLLLHVTLLLTVCNFFQANILHAKTDDLAKSAQSILSLIDSVDTIAKSIPSEHLDADALAATLDGFEEVFEWVRDNTALVAYPGMLKGARGVLIDRDGNSIDRSLLLATLLKAKGIETRLVRAELNVHESASVFLQTSSNFLYAANDLGQAEAANVDELIGDVSLIKKAHAIEAQMELRATQAFDEHEQSAAALLSRQSEIVTETKEKRFEDERQAQIVTLSDHWWVQAKVDGDWRDFDPTNEMIGMPRSSTFETYQPSEIPSAFMQLVDIRIFVEIADLEGITEQLPVLEVSVPAASLLGQNISLNFAPLNLSNQEQISDHSNDLSAFSSVIAGAEPWLGVLRIGPQTYTDKAFFQNGDLITYGPDIDTIILARSMQQASQKGVDAFAGLFDELPGETNTRASSQNETTSANSNRTVTAVWMRLDLIRPGKPKTTYWRAIYDAYHRPPSLEPIPPLEPIKLDDTERILRTFALARDTRMAIEVARTTTPYFVQLMAERLRRIKTTMAGLGRDPAQPESSLEAFSDVLNRLDLDLLSMMESRWSLNAWADTVYLDRPTVVFATRGYAATQNATGLELRRINVIDIAENSVSVKLTLADDPFQARLMQGVADTVAESKAVPGSGTLRGTAPAFVKDLENGLSWRFINENDLQTIANVSSSSLAQLRSDLAEGQAILAPMSMSFEQTGWWRIDPTSGKTLGILESGQGGVNAETVGQIGNGISAIACLATLFVDLTTGGRITATKGAVSGICLISGIMGFIPNVGVSLGATVVNTLASLIGQAIDNMLSSSDE